MERFDGFHGMKSFICPFPHCGKRYKGLNYLRIHEKSHHHEKRFTCSRCGEIFSTNAARLSHIYEKHKNRNGVVNSSELRPSRGSWSKEVDEENYAAALAAAFSNRVHNEFQHVEAVEQTQRRVSLVDMEKDDFPTRRIQLIPSGENKRLNDSRLLHPPSSKPRTTTLTLKSNVVAVNTSQPSSTSSPSSTSEPIQIEALITSQTSSASVIRHSTVNAPNGSWRGEGPIKLPTPSCPQPPTVILQTKPWLSDPLFENWRRNSYYAASIND